MCGWERFCTFAREPERRKVGIDARVSVYGTQYEVDPELAGEEIVLWWGLFDQELFVEHGEKRFGPYLPVGGPIPLHRYRAFKKTAGQKRADRIEALAALWNCRALRWRVGRTLPPSTERRRPRRRSSLLIRIRSIN